MILSGPFQGQQHYYVVPPPNTYNAIVDLACGQKVPISARDLARQVFPWCKICERLKISLELGQ